MLRTDVPPRRRAPRMRDAVVSLRSPLPLLVAGVGVTLLVIAVATLPPRPAQPDLSQIETLTQLEARAIVAREMRSGDAAAQILNQSTIRFDDGTWYLSLGEAQFHFSQRNRIVVADNPAAVQLQYRDPPR
jgi:hypothetical protein